MNDLEIKEYLMGYIIEEMELLQEKDMHGYEHVFSPKFDKRIKKYCGVKSISVKI